MTHCQAEYHITQSLCSGKYKGSLQIWHCFPEVYVIVIFYYLSHDVEEFETIYAAGDYSYFSL